MFLLFGFVLDVAELDAEVLGSQTCVLHVSLSGLCLGGKRKTR